MLYESEGTFSLTPKTGKTQRDTHHTHNRNACRLKGKIFDLLQVQVKGKGFRAVCSTYMGLILTTSQTEQRPFRGPFSSRPHCSLQFLSIQPNSEIPGIVRFDVLCPMPSGPSGECSLLFRFRKSRDQSNLSPPRRRREVAKLMIAQRKTPPVRTRWE